MSFQIWNQLPSQSLEMDTSVAVVWPRPNPADNDSNPGLLILLHGLTGNHMQWPSHCDIAALADQHNLVVAMPDGQRSFWIDEAHGLKWGEWVGQELPEILHKRLRLSTKTIIGGLSMGGYGAFRAAFDYPENFAAAFSLSGTLDVSEKAFRLRHPDLYDIGFGSDIVPGQDNDLIQKLSNSDKQLPPLFAACGTEDRLLDQNHNFVAAVDEANSAGKNIDLQWQEGPGAHNFTFWRPWLSTALKAVDSTEK